MLLNPALDPELMRLALLEAEAALLEREVPVGCVFASPSPAAPFFLLAAAHNRTNASFDPTRHAEMVALDAIGEGLSLEDLRALLASATLCVTVEPCLMCADALMRAGVGRIVFGCPNDKFGGCGTVLDVVGGKVPLTRGVRAEEAVALLKRFYARPNVRTAAAAAGAGGGEGGGEGAQP